ncbi:MAG: hypothetical protein QGF46_02775 [Planctomycetota bacterium]|jgi:hypothetical protein|nr:hypothetical protein [Planctomycetota bacterium]
MRLLEQRKPSTKVLKIVGGIMLMFPIVLLLFAQLPIYLLLALCLLPLFFIWFMIKSKMNIWLAEDELVLQMAPFPKNHIPFKSIMAIHEHMAYPWAIGKRGWGYKKSPGVTVYFAGAGPGVVIELKNKKAIWLTTNKGDLISGLIR